MFLYEEIRVQISAEGRPGEDREMVSIYKPRGEILEEINPDKNFFLDIQPLEL